MSPNQGVDLADMKKKFPLSLALTSVLDGRKTGGLKRACVKAEETKDPDAGPIRNYLKLLDTCQTLCRKSLVTFADSELKAMLDAVRSAGAGLPGKVRAKVLERTCLKLREAKDWKACCSAPSVCQVRMEG